MTSRWVAGIGWAASVDLCLQLSIWDSKSTVASTWHSSYDLATKIVSPDFESSWDFCHRQYCCYYSSPDLLLEYSTEAAVDYLSSCPIHFVDVRITRRRLLNCFASLLGIRWQTVIWYRWITNIPKHSTIASKIAAARPSDSWNTLSRLAYPILCPQFRASCFCFCFFGSFMVDSSNWFDNCHR